MGQPVSSWFSGTLSVETGSRCFGGAGFLDGGSDLLRRDKDHARHEPPRRAALPDAAYLRASVTAVSVSMPREH